MTITESILNRFGFISRKQFQAHVSDALKFELDAALEKWQSETAEAEKNRIPDPSIFANQADLYRLSPLLGTAIDILSNDIGTAKFNVKRVRGEDTRDIPNHEFELLLRTPNPLDSGLEFMQYTASNYKLNGNAIWWLNREEQGDRPAELWPVPFHKINIIPDGRLWIDHYDYLPGEGKPAVRMETWEIVHFKTYNPNNPFVGLSPLESLAVTISGDLGMRKTSTRSYVDYGGAPQSILAFKDWVADEAWKDIKAEKVQAAKRNEMMMLRGVGDGVTWMARAMANKDMQFIEQLQHNMTDIFNRMCPGLLSMLSENATEANALAARATYAEKTQWPMMEVIAQKITSDILPAYGLKLVGIFDDPRVVDKKLKLEEQAAFERTHTLEEVRQEYYQDDPLGDERDKLLPSQIQASSGGVQQPPSTPPTPPVQPGTIPPEPPQDTTPPAEGAPVDMMPDMAMQASYKMIDALIKWKRKAIKERGRAMDFVSEFIPAEKRREIKTKLQYATKPADIKAIFEEAILIERNKGGTEITYLADAINLLAKTRQAVA